MGMSKIYLNTYFYAKFDIYSAQKNHNKTMQTNKTTKKQKIKEIMTFTVLRKISLQVFAMPVWPARVTLMIIT